MTDKFLRSQIGQLRLVAFLEGLSLILLVFVAVPLKYLSDFPVLVEIIGPIHGGLFIGFIFFVWRISMAEDWKFWPTTFLVMLSSFIPFGTFIADRKLFKELHEAELAS